MIEENTNYAYVRQVKLLDESLGVFIVKPIAY